MDIFAKIVNKLIEQKLTIATMESCTGGGIANEITNISGASSVLKVSFITYSNEAKIDFGVSAEVIAKYTVYSAETAKEMAKTAKEKAKSNIAIGVTGQLGRIDPSNPVDKLNHVWFAIVDNNNNFFEREIIVPDETRANQKKVVINEIAKVLNEYI